MDYIDDCDIQNAEEASFHLTVWESLVESKQRILEEQNHREQFRRYLLEGIEKWENRIERLKERWPEAKDYQ